ncbi:SRPBCC domain-containing protein [Piscinibacter sakaiensis]|nr:SRPBCC domain-containing protein [Piscinibacter sakaiensis]
MKTLHFETTLQATPARVWDELLGPDGYRAWTAAFGEGSHFVGSWDEGARIRFLGPSGDGMSAEIAEHRPQALVSIRHLGVITGGVEDTTSDSVRAWAPAYETYRLTEVPGGCLLSVSVDTAPQWEAHMQETFPKALALLKGRCEAA